MQSSADKAKQDGRTVTCRLFSCNNEKKKKQAFDKSLESEKRGAGLSTAEGNSCSDTKREGIGSNSINSRYSRYKLLQELVQLCDCIFTDFSTLNNFLKKILRSPRSRTLQPLFDWTKCSNFQIRPI